MNCFPGPLRKTQRNRKIPIKTACARGGIFSFSTRLRFLFRQNNQKASAKNKHPQTKRIKYIRFVDTPTLIKKPHLKNSSNGAPPVKLNENMAFSTSNACDKSSERKKTHATRICTLVSIHATVTPKKPFFLRAVQIPNRRSMLENSA